MKKAETGKIKFVRDNTLIVAVDIGMEMNHGYCTTADGRDIKPFKFENTRDGMDKLWNIIVASKNRFQCNEVIVGYESTGPYAVNRKLNARFLKPKSSSQMLTAYQV